MSAIDKQQLIEDIHDDDKMLEHYRNHYNVVGCKYRHQDSQLKEKIKMIQREYELNKDKDWKFTQDKQAWDHIVEIDYSGDCYELLFPDSHHKTSNVKKMEMQDYENKFLTKKHFNEKPVMLFNSSIISIQRFSRDHCVGLDTFKHYLVEAMETLANARDYIEIIEAEIATISGKSSTIDIDEKTYAILNEIEPAIKLAIAKALQL